MMRADEPIEGLTTPRALLEAARERGVGAGRVTRTLIAVAALAPLGAGFIDPTWIDLLTAWTLLPRGDVETRRTLRLDLRQRLVDKTQKLKTATIPTYAWNRVELQWQYDQGPRVWSSLLTYLESFEHDDADRLDLAVQVCSEAETLLDDSGRTIASIGDAWSADYSIAYRLQAKTNARRVVIATLLAHLPDDAGDLDWIALEQARLARKHEDETEVRAALEGITDPAEAWETVVARDLVPVGWEEGRTFRGTVDTAWGPRKVTGARLPVTLSDVVRVATCWARMETAEALAREFAFGIAPWEPDRGRGEKIEWIFPGKERESTTHGPWPKALDVQVMEAVQRGKDAFWGTRQAEAAKWGRGPSSEWAAHARTLAEAWRTVVAARVRVKAQEKIPESLEGTRFSELTSPFAPLISLDGVGVRVFDNRGGTLVLMLGK